ncbi:MAG: hypothetical protein H6R04_1414 [Burkholderiaceae bacterium]|nr:hypothetical protein [Burkholderiaceae bacterium]
MFRKVLLTIIVGICASGAWAAEDSGLLKSERIGTLHIDMPAAKVRQAVDCAFKRGPEKWWGADGAYHQEWVSKPCGLTLGMVAAKKGGRQTVESIALAAPAKLATQQGIRIGSSEPEVERAYGRYRDADNSVKGQNFVAGSVFGGLMFSFKQGRVSQIFLGAAAE